MTVGSQSRDFQFETYGWSIYRSCFIKLVLRISGVIKAWNPSWGLRHWQSKFNYHYRICICFSNLILWSLCEKNNEGEAESIILILIISSFLSVKYFLKVWANDFSLLTFERTKPFFDIIFSNWGKTEIRPIFLSASTIWRVKYCTKICIFKVLFFSLFIIFYSLSSCPLVFTVLHKGVKNIHVRKVRFVMWHWNAESSTNRRFQLPN